MTRILSTGMILARRFQVVRLISDKGGMALVFMVQDLRESPPSTWALKQLRPQQKADPDVLKLFDQEADLLKGLSHRNIPQYRMRFDEGGEAFLVLEFVSGRTLAEVLGRQGKPADQGRVLQWSAQICDVLDYLHTRRPPIIYRDLKPDNLMVTDDDIVKVIDFGIARTFKKGKTKDTVSIGTEAYAPPEQYGSGQTDERSDIYALGATMYHLLTNSYPPHARLPGAPTSVNKINPLVSQQISEIVTRAMHKERSQRFQSAVEMKKALAALLPAHGLDVSSAPAASLPLPQSTPLPKPLKNCPNCGGACPAEARFCRYCAYSFMGLPRALLHVIQPYGFNWEKQIPGNQPLVIGTSAGGGNPGYDLSFYDKDGYVSRKHASISPSGNQYVLVDLGSTNGTRHNDVPLKPNTPVVLRHGDRIQMGQVVLQFRLG